MTYPILAHVSAASYSIPASIGIWRFRRLEKPMKLLAILAVLACIQLGVEFLVAKWIHNNSAETDYYEFVEFWFLWAVYFVFLPKKGYRLLLILLGTLFAATWIIRISCSPDTIGMGSSVNIASRIVLVAVSLVALYSLVTTGTSRLVEVPVFWVAMGVILYSAGTVMVVGFGPRLLKLGMPYFEMAWRINWLLTIAANLLYAKGLLCRVRQ